MSVFDFYSTLGWWRMPEFKQIMNSKDHNKFHHVLMIEAMGGNTEWKDRFLAFHAGVWLYWHLTLLTIISPKASYTFTELLEGLIEDTYDEFIKCNTRHL
jgi:ubiquinol oxidase